MSTPKELRLIDPQCYAEHGYPHELWTELRRESPVHFLRAGGLATTRETTTAHEPI